MVKVEVGCFINKKVIITVLVAAAQVDDIVVVGIWDNALRLSVLRQFLISSFGIVHKP